MRIQNETETTHSSTTTVKMIAVGADDDESSSPSLSLSSSSLSQNKLHQQNDNDDNSHNAVVKGTHHSNISTGSVHDKNDDDDEDIHRRRRSRLHHLFVRKVLLLAAVLTITITTATVLLVLLFQKSQTNERTTISYDSSIILAVDEPYSSFSTQPEKQRRTTTKKGGQQRQRIDGLTPYEEQTVVTWEEVVTEFPHAFQADISILREMADFASSHPSASPPLPPYISLGFAKEGTTTLHTFLECAVGGETCHFMINGVRGTQSIVECFLNAEQKFSYDYTNHLMEHCGYPEHCIGYTQMEDWSLGRIPQLDRLSNLVREEPELTLFMPFRPFHKWIDSQRRWSHDHKDIEQGQDMIHGRDGTSPYFGLDAFDTTEPRLWTETEASFFQRQLHHQQFFLSDCIRNHNHSHDDLSVKIFRKLDILRGVDELARLALFKVYYITYIRSYMKRNPHIMYIEYDLEDSNTGTFMSQIFKVSKGLKCWQHSNASDPI